MPNEFLLFSVHVLLARGRPSYSPLFSCSRGKSTSTQITHKQLLLLGEPATLSILLHYLALLCPYLSLAPFYHFEVVNAAVTCAVLEIMYACLTYAEKAFQNSTFSDQPLNDPLLY